MKHPSTLLVILFFLFSNFLQSQVKAPTAVAKQYLATQHQQLQLTESDIEDYEVRSVVVSKHNKLTHVYLRQQHAGIPVQNAIFNLNITADGQVVSFGNRFEAKLAERVNATRPQLSMQDAIVATLDHFKIPYTTIPALVEQKNAQEATFDPSEVALTPIKVRLRYQPLPNKEVRLAWQVMVEELNGNHAWSVQVDALTGELLDTYDMVLHCSFGGTPKYFAGIHASHLQHNRTYDNTGLAPETPWANPILAITTAGEAAYNVYPVPVESPNHGDRALVINPADTISSPFGWHDTDGFEGAEYTITRGNNVHAYHDIFDIDNSSGDEPDGGDSLVFDFPLDLSTNKPYTQQEPLITNLFYWNNIMHDVWYQYGFDEAAGNFQETNYTGEGLGGDHVRAQALDGRGVNNANFLTRDEGDSVRMQMFVWGNNINLEGIGPTNTFNVTTPDSLAGSYPFAAATFGDPLPPVEEAITGKVVLMDDGVGEPFDGCEPLLNAEELDGNIALVFRRDGCQDAFRVLAAQEAGAIAVMVCNSSFGDLLNMGPGSFGDQVTIPSVMIRRADCERLILGLPFEVELFNGTSLVPQPGPTGLSSDLDNGVIVHEYTHGISTRLTGGAFESQCLRNFEQAGEGWSDWFGLVMTTTPEMTAEQPRGIGTYVIDEPTDGTGIRTYPYSRDMDINPHTYANIRDFNGAVHGVGSVWCVMLWDLYWNLIDIHGFDEDFYHGTGGNNIAMQLVLDGLKIQPCSPDFIEARDAILTADSINYDGAHQCLIWETFARRGLGASAEAGGFEAFDNSRICSPLYSIVKRGPKAAQGGDTIMYVVDLFNGRSQVITNEVIIDTLPLGAVFLPDSSDCAIVEDNGILTMEVGDIAPGESWLCSYQVAIPDTPFTVIGFEDDFDPPFQSVEGTAGIGELTWRPNILFSNGGFSYHAEDTGEPSDQYLTLREPLTLEGARPALSFWQYHNLEFGVDGGVIEVNVNNQGWEDVGAAIIQNGYVDELAEDAEHPLAGRSAFTGTTRDWENVLLDLSDYTGQPFLLRFRMATNATDSIEAEEAGWYVDDLIFYDHYQTITNVACTTTSDTVQLCANVTTVISEKEIITTIEEVELAEQFTIFPNPTNGRLTVQWEGAAVFDTQLRIFSTDGRLLFQNQYNAFQREELNLSSYSPGIYLVQLQTPQGTTTQRVVIQ